MNMKTRPLFFIFIIFTLILCSSSASAYTYDGDAKFGDDGWSLVYGITGGEFETIVGGINNIHTNNTASYQYRLATGLDAAAGYTIETRFKLYSDSTNLVLDIHDSTYEWKATINPAAIYAHTESVVTDTTDDYHVYHFVRKGTNFTIYKDYVDIWNTTTANDASGFDRLDIGESSSSKLSNLSIDYIDVQSYNIPSPPVVGSPTTTIAYDNFSELEHNNTIVTYRNISLKNGWNPANEWWGESGGVWATLDDALYKADILFTAPTNQTVEAVGFIAYTCEGNTTSYKIGLQADNNGTASGTYLSHGIWNTSEYVGSNRFYTTSLLSNTSIVENQRYHLVMEYDSGDIDGSNYTTLKGMKSADGDTGDGHNGFMPSFNYGGYDPNVAIKDTFYWASRSFDNGSTWVAGANNRESPNFVLNFTDGDQFGAMALHDYEGVDGPDFKGEKIIISNGNKSVDEISSYFWRESSNVTLYPIPNDDLYYQIQDSNHTILRSGTLLTKEDFSVDSAGRWFETNLASPLTLEDAGTYYVVFNSPNTNNSCYYGHDAGGPTYAASYGYLWSYNLTYGGQDAILVVSNIAGDSWTEYPQNDYSFGLHLVNVTTGNVISPKQNATTGYIFDTISYDGVVPSGTSIDIYASYSLDNSSYTEYSLIQEDAQPDTVYNISNTQYIIPKFVLSTTNTSINPEINSISLNTDVSENTSFSILIYTPTDTTPSSSTGTEQTFTVDLNTAGNITWLINGTVFQTNTSVTNATYFNSTAPAGIYNVTASATDGSTNATQSWTWTVTEVPVTPTTDEENTAANVWITNIGMISVAMMMMIIAVPIIVIRNNKTIDAKTIDNMIFAVVVIFIVGVVAILGTGTLQEIGLLMP